MAHAALRGVVPVSYTHLDVYKRQMQNSTDLDRVDKYSRLRTALATSNKLRCQGNDLGPEEELLRSDVSQISSEAFICSQWLLDKDNPPEAYLPSVCVCVCAFDQWLLF